MIDRRKKRAATVVCAALSAFWGVALSGCPTPERPRPPDAGTDAPIEAGVDAPPPDPCPPIGAVLEVAESTCPEIDRLTRICAAQDACDVVFVERDGTRASATIADREVAVTIGGIECTATLDNLGGADLACRDSLGIRCNARLRGIELADAPACCTLETSCEAGAACTLVAPAGAGPIAATACVARTGSVALGGTCVRAEPGHDDCAAGLFCTRLGAATETACRALCAADVDCGAGELCADAGAVPALGLCVAGCDPFVTDACGAGLGCAQITDVSGTVSLACLASGDVAMGETCTVDACQAGLVCVSPSSTEPPRCRSFCDPDHLCPAGSDCVPVAGSVGGCVPSP